MKKILTAILVLGMTASTLYPAQPSLAATSASNGIVLSTNKVTLTVGKSKQISTNQAVTWKISNKKIVQAKKITAKKLKITAKKPGSCTILAQKGKRKARVSIRVTTPKKINATATPLVTVAPANTVQAATQNPIVTTTATAQATQSLTATSTTTAQVTQSPTATSTATTQTTQSPTATSTTTAQTTQSPVTATPVETATATPLATTNANTEATTTPDAGIQTPEPTIRVSESPVVVSTPGIIETATPVPTETPAVTETPGPTTSETPAIPVSEVEMTVREVKDDSAKISFTNHSDLYAFYLYKFTLEMKVDGEWKKVPTLPDHPITIPDLATTLEPGRTKDYEVNVDLDSYDTPLQAGTYRLVEPVRLFDPSLNDAGKMITCYGEFTILPEDEVLSNFGYVRSHSYFPANDSVSEIIYTREQFDSLTDEHGNSDRMPKEVTEFADSIDFSKSALALQIITCSSGSTKLELHGATVQNNSWPFVKFDYGLHTPSGEVTCDMISYILYAEVPLTYILK